MLAHLKHQDAFVGPTMTDLSSLVTESNVFRLPIACKHKRIAIPGSWGGKTIAFSFLQSCTHCCSHTITNMYRAAHMLVTVSVHIQHLDTQLCQDKSIMLSYYAARDAVENCMPHPSSVLFFRLKINRQINKSETYSHLGVGKGDLVLAVQDIQWRFEVSSALRVNFLFLFVFLSFHSTICEEHSMTLWK